LVGVERAARAATRARGRPVEDTSLLCGCCGDTAQGRLPRVPASRRMQERAGARVDCRSSVVQSDTVGSVCSGDRFATKPAAESPLPQLPIDLAATGCKGRVRPSLLAFNLLPERSVATSGNLTADAGKARRCLRYQSWMQAERRECQ
jgi:hypothetical protein